MLGVASPRVRKKKKTHLGVGIKEKKRKKRGEEEKDQRRIPDKKSYKRKPLQEMGMPN